jgi:PAS domain S-box-containing protein
MKTNGGEIQPQDAPERYEKLYGMLLDAIPSSILLIDRDMRIVSANQNFLEKSRRSMSDTINHRLEEVFPSTILEHMDITKRIRQVFNSNEPTMGERMTYRAPGIPMRIYYYSILPFSWSGVVENAMLLMEDVTEQIRLSEEVRRVERHLASVVESASDIVLSTDTEGRILTWNTAAEKVSGYGLDEVKGHFFFEYCAEGCHEEVKKVFSSKGARKNSRMAEWGLVTNDREVVPVSWVCSPMKDDLSRCIGIVAVGRDLTERRKFEMQLLQSQKLAALGVMAGGIAHEIRNPLAICSSAAQFLMDDDLSPEFMKECAEKIQVGIRRASGIIQSLLRFARPSATTQMEQVNLVSLLTETLTLVVNQARIQKITLRSDFPDRPVPISGIAGLLQQAFMNLLLNAINAMPNGGTLSVSAEKSESEALVRVADTGHGISQEEMHKIFDPFYTTSPAGKGTGLGLSICYSIVKQHYGSIEVDSVEGKGSTFTVRLPIR